MNSLNKIDSDHLVNCDNSTIVDLRTTNNSSIYIDDWNFENSSNVDLLDAVEDQKPSENLRSFDVEKSLTDQWKNSSNENEFLSDKNSCQQSKLDICPLKRKSK